MKRRVWAPPVRCCLACERPLPPAGAVCPYCDEPLPVSWMNRLGMACCGTAAALSLITLGITRTVPLLSLPATLGHGLLLAGGAAILLTPFHWQGLRPPTRHERLEAIRHCLGQRFCTALATVALLFVLRRAPHTGLRVVAGATLLVTLAVAVVSSRDTRAGFLAGLLIGLA